MKSNQFDGKIVYIAFVAWFATFGIAKQQQQQQQEIPIYTDIK